jgi:hypothetical protein
VILLTLASVACGGKAKHAGSREVDVSNRVGNQTHATIAVQPGRPSILLAASVDRTAQTTTRLYSSVNGGRTWTSTLRPQTHSGNTCSIDPAVTIDRRGRQFFTFLDGACQATDGARVYVAHRNGPSGAWRTASPSAVGPGEFDDNPSVAVDDSNGDHAGRLYAAWGHFDLPRGRSAILVAQSDDAGRSWSAPVRVSDDVDSVYEHAIIGVANDGEVYVTFVAPRGILIDRARPGDRLRFGKDVLVDPLNQLSTGALCRTSGVRVAAQPGDCVRPIPTPLITPDGVTVIFSAIRHGTDQHAVFATLLTPQLTREGGRAARRIPVATPPTPGKYDQFLPAAALDATDGVLWACFYRAGPQDRRTARFMCSGSRDYGRTWSTAVAAASVDSNQTLPNRPPDGFGAWEGVAAAGGVAHPIWTDTRRFAARGEEIYTRALKASALRFPD